MHLRSVINSLNPRITKAAIAQGGGNQLLLRLFASWKYKEYYINKYE